MKDKPKLPKIHALGRVLLVLAWLLPMTGVTLITFYEEAGLDSAVGFACFFAGIMLLVPSTHLRILGTDPEEACVRNWNQFYAGALKFWTGIIVVFFVIGGYFFGFQNLLQSLWICIPSLITSYVTFAVFRKERLWFRMNPMLPAGKE